MSSDRDEPSRVRNPFDISSQTAELDFLLEDGLDEEHLKQKYIRNSNNNNDNKNASNSSSANSTSSDADADIDEVERPSDPVLAGLFDRMALIMQNGYKGYEDFYTRCFDDLTQGDDDVEVEVGTAVEAWRVVLRGPHRYPLFEAWATYLFTMHFDDGISKEQWDKGLQFFQQVPLSDFRGYSFNSQHQHYPRLFDEFVTFCMDNGLVRQAEEAEEQAKKQKRTQDKKDQAKTQTKTQAKALSANLFDASSQDATFVSLFGGRDKVTPMSLEQIYQHMEDDDEVDSEEEYYRDKRRGGQRQQQQDDDGDDYDYEAFDDNNGNGNDGKQKGGPDSDEAYRQRLLNGSANNNNNKGKGVSSSPSGSPQGFDWDDNDDMPGLEPDSPTNTGVAGLEEDDEGSLGKDKTKSPFDLDSILSSFSKSKNKDDDTGLVGLSNQGATCYMNSLLQSLFMTPEFRAQLYKWTFDAERDGEAAECIPLQLQKLFVELQSSKESSTGTKPLTKAFGWESEDAFRQQDVQELMRVLFEAFEETMTTEQYDALVASLYQGMFKGYVFCKSCQKESARVEKFMDLSLVVRDLRSVGQAVKAFITPELLEGANAYKCSGCGPSTAALKGTHLVSLPYILTLQLKRFDLNYETMQRVKLNHRVRFPFYLDMGPFVGDEPSVFKDGAQGVEDEEDEDDEEEEEEEKKNAFADVFSGPSFDFDTSGTFSWSKQ